MRRTYRQTELWMSYGVVAGMLVGVLLMVFTGNPLWLAFLPLGVVVGMLVGTYRDRAGGAPRGPVGHH